MCRIVVSWSQLERALEEESGAEAIGLIVVTLNEILRAETGRTYLVDQLSGEFFTWNRDNELVEGLRDCREQAKEVHKALRKRNSRLAILAETIVKQVGEYCKDFSVDLKLHDNTFQESHTRLLKESIADLIREISHSLGHAAPTPSSLDLSQFAWRDLLEYACSQDECSISETQVSKMIEHVCGRTKESAATWLSVEHELVGYEHVKPHLVVGCVLRSTDYAADGATRYYRSVTSISKATTKIFGASLTNRMLQDFATKHSLTLPTMEKGRKPPDEKLNEILGID